MCSTPSCEGGFAILQSIMTFPEVAQGKAQSIFTEDCDICLHPYWSDELVDGVCERCIEHRHLTEQG